MVNVYKMNIYTVQFLFALCFHANCIAHLIMLSINVINSNVTAMTTLNLSRLDQLLGTSQLVREVWSSITGSVKSDTVATY